MKIGERVGNLVIVRIDFAYPVHRPTFYLRSIATRRGLLDYARMIIRDATEEDASAACDVMRRSIAELCVADHRNDPTILGRWLSNKTPEIFKTWIRPSNTLLVAVEDNAILAVGCITDVGEITLNYVSPGVRFRGVSAALLGVLEANAKDRGSKCCTLKSTETARRFYLDRGYSEDGPPAGKFGTNGDYPMSKRLTDPIL